MRRTKEEAERTRQAILEAALTVFSEQGYQAARLAEIASAAGTTRGAIYHHFQNKVGLYQALIAAASQQGGSAIQTAVAAGGTFAEICRKILENTFALLASDRRFREVMALSLFKTGVSTELADLEKQRLQQATSLVASVAAYMAHGMQTGEARDDLSPEALAQAFLAYQNGIALLWLANGQFFDLEDAAPALTDILLHGILNPQRS